MPASSSAGERPRVKLECLRMLATLRLDPARVRLVSGFLDTYLRLTAREQRLFASELESVPDQEMGSVMEIVTSWMEEGIEKGIEQGRAQGMARGREEGREIGRREGVAQTLLRQLAQASRVTALPVDALDRLAEELLRFSSRADFEAWLANERG